MNIIQRVTGEKCRKYPLVFWKSTSHHSNWLSKGETLPVCLQRGIQRTLPMDRLRIEAQAYWKGRIGPKTGLT